MKKKSYVVCSKVWLYPGASAAWHFTTVPKKTSDELKKKFGKFARGWNSLPVLAKIGKTSWTTSIFYDSRSGAYLLPLKASVRKAEAVDAGESVEYRIEIRS